MLKEDLEKFNGKRVFIVLNNNFKYSGLILKITEESLFIQDQFNHAVVLSNSGILSIQEEVRE